MNERTAAAWYDENAAAVADRHELVSSANLFAWASDLLPSDGALVLDVGAGSGRDAAWFAGRGASVVAVEPSTAMRAEAVLRHPGNAVRWLDDRMPTLAVTTRLGLSFDLVLVSAVWQHVPPADRDRAFRKLTSMLKPGGLMLLTLRMGEADDSRDIHPVDGAEVERLARDHGLAVTRVQHMTDALGRPDVRWTGMALRLPDDGTGALPLLRHLILNDSKSSTYKLALLRTLCRIADGSSGLVRDGADDRHVVVPLGLVALVWLRLFLPLLRRDLPQSAQNTRGGQALGFAKAGFVALASSSVRPADLHPGALLGTDVAKALDAALAESSKTIVEMPARYLTFPGGDGPVFPVVRSSSRRSAPTMLDAAYLGSFGELRVPRHLWQAMQRYACWVEPALTAEWVRLMKGYAGGQGRTLEPDAIAAGTLWSEPERDTALPRQRAFRLIAAGERVHCVWSGKRLDASALDIDHCFPWAAWPCGDLWNLLPADRRLNQQSKRDRLPTQETLARAEGAISEWWQAAYLRGDVLPSRFYEEANASLPGLIAREAVEAGPAELLSAMHLQRLRLKHDQQVPDWRSPGQ